MPRTEGSGKLRRRPSLPGSAKVIRLKESVYQQRRERKTSTGFSNSTDTEFAEIVLHSLPNENRRNLIYHKITVGTGLLQNNAYGHELVLFCLIIPCVHCLFMFYFYKIVSGYSSFASIDIGRCDRSRNQSIGLQQIHVGHVYALNAKSVLEQSCPVTSNDEDVNILTTCFCLIIFISSGSGYSGFSSIEIDRSIDRSIGCYKSSIRVDYKVRSRVVFSGNIQR